MALSEATDIAFVIVLVVAAALFVAFVKFWLPKLMRRRMASKTGDSAWMDDRAYNAIQAGNALLNFLEGEGIPSPNASVLLARAQTKFEIKNYDEAASLAKEATGMLAAQRRAAKKGSGPVQYKSSSSTSAPAALGTSVPSSSSGSSKPSSEPTPRVFRDLSRKVGEPDPDTVPPPASAEVPPSRGTASLASPAPSNPSGDSGGSTMDEGEQDELSAPSGDEEPPLKAAARKLPKNFMESRFMLTSLQNDLSSATDAQRSTPEGKEAQDWAQKSQAAFDRKDYDESLRLALRGRRRFGGAGMSTISVGPGTVVDAPPSEASPSAQRSSAPVGAVASPSDSTTCARCGRSNNAGDRFCRGCGAPMAQAKCPRCGRPAEPDDKFCHGCGSPLTTPI